MNKNKLIVINLNTNNKLFNIDIYFTAEYGKICEITDKNVWECCIYNSVIYPYIKRTILFNNIKYYDLISPYGYSGIYYENINDFIEFRKLFKIYALKNNYITEVIKQSPYMNIDINNYFERITSRKTYGINLQNYNFSNLSKNNKRYIKKAIKNDCNFEFSNDIQEFIKIYDLTMRNLQASEYYLFSEEYYNKLFELFKDNIKIASVKYKNKYVAMAIIFEYNNFLHYHLGGSLIEYRNSGINNFLHYNVALYGRKNNYKLYHLGGGLYENDSLAQFKERISDFQFDYNIYKNIINDNIYNKICSNYKDNKNNISYNQNYFPLYKQ